MDIAVIDSSLVRYEKLKRRLIWFLAMVWGVRSRK